MVVFINEELEVIQPGQVSAILAEHRAKIKHLEDYEATQNHTAQRTEEKLDKFIERTDDKFEKVYQKLDETKDLIHELVEKNNDKRDSKIGQRIGWGFTALAILISIGALIVNLTK